MNLLKQGILAGLVVPGLLAGAAAVPAHLDAAPAVRTVGARAGFAEAAATAAVRTGGGPLNVRSNASTWRKPVKRLPEGTRVAVRCQIGGDRIAGTVRTTAIWLRIGARRYVSEAFIAWWPRRPSVPWCDMPADPAPRYQDRFVRWAAKYARAGWREYRVPASVTVAQAILESGWGRSALTTEGNAYFGIKCFGTPGPVAVGCRPYRTSECDADDCFAITDSFRVYRTAARSFRDHGRFLTVNPRYRPAFEHVRNPDRFAREIHKAGYATGPNYSDKLIALMRIYDLYRFDP